MLWRGQIQPHAGTLIASAAISPCCPAWDNQTMIKRSVRRGRALPSAAPYDDVEAFNANRKYGIWHLGADF